ncbi:MAG: hypothetical protein IH899_08270, partial [Planctomycetes bacterium]|nr:hypothetical protein [Planctomycetota bacterium]
MVQIRWGSVSITGNYRENNEDNYLADPDARYFLIADGMGGQVAGEKASELTTLDRESNPQRELTPEHSLPVIKSPLEDEGESSSEAAFRSFAEYFREDLENAKIPPLEPDGEEQSIDYVLIDSRTGFPELLDLSLGYLGDKMVLVSGINDQNLIGLQETFKALNRRVPVDTLPAYVTVVISPIPAAEDDALFDRLKIVHERIEQSMRLTQSGMPELSPAVRYIHYTPILSMSEAALAVERPESSYAQEVASIADELEWSPEEAEGGYVFRFHEEYAFAARARDEVRSKVLELTTEAQTSAEEGIPTDVASETQKLL